MESLELILLFDYYGDLLIDHPDVRVAELAEKIRSCAAGIEE